MDYGKYKYEQEQKAKKAKKRQHIIEVKEIKFRPKISAGDYETKKRHVERFLKAGSKVKVTIMFRGREMAHPELGRNILDRLSEDVAEFSTVESQPKLDGRNMVMVLGSTVKKQSEKRPENNEEEKEKKIAKKEDIKKPEGQEKSDAKKEDA